MSMPLYLQFSDHMSGNDLEYHQNEFSLQKLNIKISSLILPTNVSTNFICNIS